MDDFSKEFCNWEKLREKRNNIVTEIDNNLKTLINKDKNLYSIYRLENKSLLKSIRDYIVNHDEEITFKKESDKLVSLIEVYCYLCDIEFKLTQIRLHNNYIKKYNED